MESAQPGSNLQAFCVSDNQSALLPTPLSRSANLSTHCNGPEDVRFPLNFLNDSISQIFYNFHLQMRHVVQNIATSFFI